MNTFARLPRLPRLLTALAAAAALLVPAGARAQAPVAFSATGYGALGAAAGSLLGLAADSDCEGFICIPAGAAIGFIGGAVTGGIVGHGVATTANRQLAAGQPLSPGRRFAVGLGAALGGATVGATLAGIAFGHSDVGDSTLSTAVLVSTGAGMAWALLGMRDMVPGDLSALRVTPAAGLDGRVGLTAELRF